MKFRDTFTLVGSKLKIRKLRTAVSIITASILFGVVITILIVAKGFFNNITKLAKTTHGDNILLSVEHQNDEARTPKIQEKAIELYNESIDPNKQYPIITPEPDPIDGHITPPYLDENSPFAIAAASLLQSEQNQTAKSAIAKIVAPYGGEVAAAINRYCNNSVFIEKLTPPHYADTNTTGCFSDTAGRGVLAVDSDIFANFIKISQQKDDVIQVLVPLDQAAKLVNINKPRYAEPNSTTHLQDYIIAVNQQAIGHQFIGTTTTDDNQTIELTYEIVGLLPAYEAVSTIDPFSINPLENTTSSIQSDSNLPFIITNPKSTAFKSSYVIEIYEYSTNVIASFDSVDKIEAFIRDVKNSSFNLSYIELISNQLTIHETSNNIYRTITTFTIIFTIISIIIMAGTISRVIDDERSSIALYRAIGATTKNILKIYASYILILSLLIVICSTIIGFALSAIITATNTTQVTANISAMYNLPNLAHIIFIGFDPRILLIYLAIFGIGIVCLFLTLDKLISKNIIKNLRK